MENARPVQCLGHRGVSRMQNAQHWPWNGTTHRDFRHQRSLHGYGTMEIGSHVECIWMSLESNEYQYIHWNQNMEVS